MKIALRNKELVAPVVVGYSSGV